MTGYWLLILHCVGDYLLQSDWMATEKTNGWSPAIAHATVYTLPFMLLFGLHWQPLIFIGGTHLLIDHYRLARYVCWAKNFLSPKTTVTFTPDTKGAWHRNVEALGCKPNDKGVYTCMDHGHLRATRTVTDWQHPWNECQGTGYHRDKPAWLTVWLLIIADNTMHLALNGLAWVIWGTPWA